MFVGRSLGKQIVHRRNFELIYPERNSTCETQNLKVTNVI